MAALSPWPICRAVHRPPLWSSFSRVQRSPIVPTPTHPSLMTPLPLVLTSLLLLRHSHFPMRLFGAVGGSSGGRFVCLAPDLQLAVLVSEPRLGGSCCSCLEASSFIFCCGCDADDLAFASQMSEFRPAWPSRLCVMD